MNAEERAALHARVAAHSNLRLQQRTHDMREVYRRTHTLLVPTQREAAWGRVATEAQFSGIPVLASDRGGLPAAVGPDGRVRPHDAPAEVWAAALQHYWTHATVYKDGSAEAQAHNDRPHIDHTPQRSNKKRVR